MTSTLADPAAQPSTTRHSTIGFGNVVRSEWTKLRSLRSSRLCAALVVLLMFGLAIVMGARWAHQSGAMPDGFDATNVGLSVLATVTLIGGEIVTVSSFLVCQAFLAHNHAGVSLADPGVLAAVLGSGLFLTAVALLGVGLGATLRHTAGAISAFFGVVFALPAVVDLLPTTWRNDIIDYLPLNAASQILETMHKQGALGPWQGLGVFCLYMIAALVAGAVVVSSRDA